MKSGVPLRSELETSTPTSLPVAWSTALVAVALHHFDLYRRGRLPLDRLISHRLPLEQVGRARFERRTLETGARHVSVDAADYAAVPATVTLNGTLGRVTTGDAAVRIEHWDGRVDHWPAPPREQMDARRPPRSRYAANRR